VIISSSPNRIWSGQLQKRQTIQCARVCHCLRIRFPNWLVAAIARIAVCASYLMFVLTGSYRARRSPLCVFSYRHTIILLVFILILSVILGNSCSYPMGILQRERTLNSLRRLYAIIAVMFMTCRIIIF